MELDWISADLKGGADRVDGNVADTLRPLGEEHGHPLTRVHLTFMLLSWRGLLYVEAQSLSHAVSNEVTLIFSRNIPNIGPLIWSSAYIILNASYSPSS